MADDAPFKPPRKKINVFWFIGGVLLLLVALFIFQLCGPKPPIEISPETTYITEPLAADGLPDYARFVIDAKRKDVTRENNAAVLMFQALGPLDIEPENWAQISKELGLPSEPAEPILTKLYGNDLRSKVKSWLVDNVDGWKAASVDQPDPDTGMSVLDERVEDAIGETMDTPWRSEQLPPMTEWIRENRTPLDLLVEASRRPRFCLPLSVQSSSTDGPLLTMTFDGISQSRTVARALLLDAMWQLGEGRQEAAWNDLHAVHRWARLVGQGDTIIEQLVAAAIEGIAVSGTSVLLSDPNMNAALARQVQSDLAAMPPVCNMAKSFDGMERLIFLDMVVWGKRQGLAKFLSGFGSLEDDGGFAPLDYLSVDWNVTLMRGNELFNRLTKVFGLTTHAERVTEISKISAELNQQYNEFRKPGSWIASAVSPVRRSDMLAAFVIVSTASPFDGCVYAEDRPKTLFELLRTAAALAVYRAENGKFPEKLDDLPQNLLTTLPVDDYSGKPLIYKRTDDGYLLYSAGENGVDDGGSHFDWSILDGRKLDDSESAKGKKLQSKIPAGADDISIRVPCPAFKLPEPPKAAPAADGP